MTTELTKYDAARSALSEAHRVDEVKDIRDKAIALAAYARQAKDTAMVEWVTEIKVRAERRLGEMLREQKATVGMAPAGRPKIGSDEEPISSVPTLAQVGIDKKLSSRAQALAAMPEEHFETAIATAKEHAGQVSTAHMLRASKHDVSRLYDEDSSISALSLARQAKGAIRQIGTLDPRAIEAIDSIQSALDERRNHIIERKEK